MSILDDDPVRLCCGQRHPGVICPDGKVQCCLCFSRFTIGDLFKDPDGTIWDICRACENAETTRKRTGGTP